MFVQHGYSLERCFAACERANGTTLGMDAVAHAGVFLVLRTLDGQVMGAFSDRPLQPAPAAAAICTGGKGCFVFRFCPAGSEEAEVYRWSGLNDSFFRLTRPSQSAEAHASSAVSARQLLLSPLSEPACSVVPVPQQALSLWPQLNGLRWQAALSLGGGDSSSGYAIYLDGNGQSGSR
jgi:hypothetical protein